MANHQHSLIMNRTIQQVSTGDDGDSQTSHSNSPDGVILPSLSAFGSEFRLTCPVCIQDLKEPKQLKSCYHIFCANCLVTSISNAKEGYIECPACGKKCPEEDISKAVQSSTYLHTLQGCVSVYAESGDVSCGEASHERKEAASYFCLECGVNFCENCYLNHSDNDRFAKHRCLKLFKAPTTMTVGMHTEREVGLAAAGGDEVDAGPMIYKCPVCRQYDTCSHELWIKDLEDDAFRKNEICSEHSEVEGNSLISFCENCEKPICRNCSMIEHKNHKTVNINRPIEGKLLELKSLKKKLEFQKEIFADAAKHADTAERAFIDHIGKTEQEMLRRKGLVQTNVEEAFNTAFSLVEQTGRKQAELNKQSREMKEEEEFLNASIEMIHRTMEGNASHVEILNVWRGISHISKALEGEDKESGVEDVVAPQVIDEKRLVLPAYNCMKPDLRILQKVGIEGNVLRKSFVLKADEELFFFYSILPLTETEALLSCQTRPCITSVVQYSNISDHRYSIDLKDEGQYNIIAVPGNGIVATLYQVPGSCGSAGKNEVWFWDQVLDRSMKEHEARGVRNQLKKIAETKYPPRGLAVTRDNHLVVCTAQDPKQGEDTHCCILIMTMQGDTLRSKLLPAASAPPDSQQYFPRYVTVNINDDICITDEKNKSIMIFSSKLELVNLICNPYEKDELNRNFCPAGICHDKFGRLIVADSNNHTILRLQSDDNEVTKAWKTEVLLQNGFNKLKDFSYPNVVALGQGPKLWVACRSNIHVFDYMDKE